MIDTLKIACRQVVLNERDFDSVRSVVDMAGRRSVRWVLNADGIGVTYYPAARFLLVEVSLTKLAGVEWHRNAVLAELWQGVCWLNDWLASRFDGLEDVIDWEVYRVDFAWNLRVENAAQEVGSLQRALKGHKQVRFDSSGVVWKSAARWVKFYDKGREQRKAGEVLRFEVSLLRKGVREVAGLLGVDVVTLADVMDERLAYCVMVNWLDKLGLLAAADDENVLMQMKEVFGSRTATAVWVRSLIAEYGENVLRTGLIASSTYYRYRNELLKYGFLGDEVREKIGDAVGVRLARDFARNLEKIFGRASSASKYGQKIFPKNFLGLCGDRAREVEAIFERVME